jgi:electron transport complex protein RnfG
MEAVAPDGYDGSIRILVGIRANGTLLGVRVLSHHETRGLGDGIDLKNGNWILRFDGKSLRDPADKAWGVKRDGGEFDQLSGATISSRAIVGAVHRALLYFESHRDALFARSP